MFLFTTPPVREPTPASPVVDAIRSGADKTGTGFDYLLATAQRESALDPAAKAKTSSATGLFQFIEQTWLGLLKQEGSKLGLDEQAKAIATGSDGRHTVADPATRQAILELRQDPEIASVMAGALTQRNRSVLASELGREPARGDLYVAHVLGARGATDLIKMADAAPERAAASAFPEAAAANRGIFYERGGRARTAGEVYAALGAHHGLREAPAVAAPSRAVAVRTGVPALHGLFRTDGRTGPISDSVGRLWRTGAEAGPRTAALGGYFPRTATVAAGEVPEVSPPIAVPADRPAAGPVEPATGAVPLPPRRPAGLGIGVPRPAEVGAPFDPGAFTKGRRA